MTKVIVYNQAGEKLADRTVSDEIFGVPLKNEVVHQVYVALRANARMPWANAKDRSEVRGGGKKPWKQKGTGRARHGSIRSPIWTGGGVTFGPLSARNYVQKINKKVKKLATRMTLSDRVKQERLYIVDQMDFQGKASVAARMRHALPGNGKSTLFLVEQHTPELTRAVRNVPQIDVVRAQDVNVVDIMHHQYIFATPEAVDVLEKRLA